MKENLFPNILYLTLQVRQTKYEAVRARIFEGNDETKVEKQVVPRVG